MCLVNSLLKRTSSFTLEHFKLHILFIAAGWLVFATPALAVVQTSGCYEADSCLLSELLADPLNYIQIDNTRFDSFRLNDNFFPFRDMDPSGLLVFPLTDIPTRPGIRIEPLTGNTDWLYEYCTVDLNFYFNSRVDFNVTAVSDTIVNFVLDADIENINRLIEDPYFPGQQVVEGGTFHGVIRLFDEYIDPNGNPQTFTLRQEHFCDPVGFDPFFCGTYGADALPLEPGFTGIKSSYPFQIEFIGAGDPYVEDDFTCSIKSDLKAIELRVILGGVPVTIDSASGMISNNFFDAGLQNWDATGPGTVSVVTEGMGNAVALSTSTSPQTLSQLINTPRSSFMINFDYRFTQPAGSLDVLINGTLITSLPAELSQDFRHKEILVNDPALMGLANTTLSFQLNPASDAAVEISNIISPIFQLVSENVDARVQLMESGNDLPIVQESNNFSVFVHDEFNLVTPSPFLRDSFMSADAQVSATSLGGIEWGSQILMEDFPQPDYAAAPFSASAETNADLIYRIISLGPNVEYGDLVNIDYVLRINGDIEFTGDEELPGKAVYQLGTLHGLSRVNNRFSYNGSVRLGENNDPIRSYSLALPSIANCSPEILEEIDNLPTNDEAVELVYELLDNEIPISRIYRVDQVYCFENMLYASVGDKIKVSGYSELSAGKIQKGKVNADFIHTVTMKLFSDNADVGFELVGDDPPPTGNNPPTADAGEDKTVEATSSAETFVTLDASDSSDPDGDVLTYSWNGPFGVVSGVSPIVALPLGTNSVILTVTDPDGLSDSDSVNIIVEDTTPPTVIAPPDLTISATGALTEVNLEQWGAATANDLVDGPLTPTPNLTGPFAPGTYTIVWSATDNAGNAGSAEQTVRVLFDFQGFFRPVENLPILNSIKAGRGVPFKWQVSDGQGGFVSDLGIVASRQYESVACDDGALGGENLIDAVTEGQSGLHYDFESNQYVYVWNTPSGSNGQCVEFVVRLIDGSEHRAKFELK